MEVLFDFDDFLIKPVDTSYIDSRKEIDIYQRSDLPIMTAPMDTVVSQQNASLFRFFDITLCFPRNTKANTNISDTSDFISISLDDFEMMYLQDMFTPSKKYLVDIANGHMKKLLDLVSFVKKDNPSITLMVGNVANVKTYIKLSNAGADYIRVGIGNGNACLTTVQTGVGYPMASLIMECSKAKQSLHKPAFIVADGGFKKYSDIIKAIAMGADYVMLGSIFNKTIESAGDNYLYGFIPVSQKLAEILFDYKFPIYKKFRGMSTKEVQKKWNKKALTTSEGIVTKRKVEYTLDGWLSNFRDYLKTAMSYSGSSNLEEFRKNCKFVSISQKSFERFSK
jgi:GMP reductase